MQKIRNLSLLLICCGILFWSGTVAYASEAGTDAVPGQDGFEVLSTVMVANDEANVRTGPGTDYRSLGKLEIGQDVYVLGRMPDNWYQISYDNQNAYVSCDYLTAPEVDETLAQEMQESITDNLSQLPDYNTEIEQLRQELAESQNALEEARKAAENAMAELAAEREKKKTVTFPFMALITAGLFLAVFIGGFILVMKQGRAEWSDGDKEAGEGKLQKGDEDDGLELISLAEGVKTETPMQEEEEGRPGKDT